MSINSDNKMQDLSQEIAADLFDPPPQSTKFGILDIKADSINTLPHFTEEATILAMKNLGITENDLILISSRTDDPIKVSDESGMKYKIINEFEKKRLEMIKKIIIERNRIMMDESVNISIANEINEAHDDIDIQNVTQTNNKSQTLRRKKKGKQNINQVNKKWKTKKKSSIPVKTNDEIADIESLSQRNTKRRKRKSTRNSPHKFQSQRGKELAKNSSHPSCQSKNSIKPSTNRRPSVAERRQKHNQNPNIDQETNQNAEAFQTHEKRNFKEYEANRKNDLLLISMRVKANEERRRMEREEKQQLIKRQAQLRLERLKGEETQFEQLKKDKKSKYEDEMKRKEKLYMKIQERKMKALEQDKKKRQQQIYNNKIKQEEDNEAEARFSKLRQKIIDAQKNKAANQNISIVNADNNSETDLFSVTQPSHPKKINSQKNNLSNSIANKAPTSINALNDNKNNITSNSIKHNNEPEENAYNNNLPKQKNKNNSTINPKPLLSSTLNPKPTRNFQPQQYPKARSSLQSKNSAYYRQLLKLPVVGKNKTKIPYLRK